LRKVLERGHKTQHAADALYRGVRRVCEDLEEVARFWGVPVTAEPREEPLVADLLEKEDRRLGLRRGR
jgi:hypothetical protein